MSPLPAAAGRRSSTRPRRSTSSARSTRPPRRAARASPTSPRRPSATAPRSPPTTRHSARGLEPALLAGAVRGFATSCDRRPAPSSRPSAALTISTADRPMPKGGSRISTPSVGRSAPNRAAGGSGRSTARPLGWIETRERQVISASAGSGGRRARGVPPVDPRGARRGRGDRPHPRPARDLALAAARVSPPDYLVAELGERPGRGPGGSPGTGRCGRSRATGSETGFWTETPRSGRRPRIGRRGRSASVSSGRSDGRDASWGSSGRQGSSGPRRARWGSRCEARGRDFRRCRRGATSVTARPEGDGAKKSRSSPSRAVEPADRIRQPSGPRRDRSVAATGSCDPFEASPRPVDPLGPRGCGGRAGAPIRGPPGGPPAGPPRGPAAQRGEGRKNGIKAAIAQIRKS